MLSRSRQKYFNSLKNKKFRDEYGVFVAEGDRLVRDLISHFEVRSLVAKQSWIEENSRILTGLACEIIDVTADEMGKISMLNTPSAVYGVFDRRPQSVNLSSDIVLALDTIQDPGNLGTIIRTADWFGVHQILCSYETADVYNPKVVQSTMGAIARVNLCYCNLADVLKKMHNEGWKIYGTFLNGESLYETQIEKNGVVIVMGNEGNGISESLSQLVDNRLLIPSFPTNTPTSESLNVSIATAIILSEFRRP